MEEYEYSFEVDEIEPYIEYCEKNSYELHKSNTQKRIVYENFYNKNVLARITTEIENNNEITKIDFKNVTKNEKILKVSNESIPMLITSENIAVVESILEVLRFIKVSELKRKRYIYKKNNVKFEIDKYIEPIMNVVAIEGEKSSVDSVYKKIKDSKNIGEPKE